MKPTTCSQCGERILLHWSVCPVCAAHLAEPTSNPTIINDFSGVEVTAKNIHCVKCGVIIAPDAQICPGCHVLIVRRYCSGCSRLIPDQAETCPHCATPASAKKSRFRFFSHTFLILSIPACVIAAFVFVVFRFSSSSDEPSSTEPVRNVKKTPIPPAPVATIISDNSQPAPPVKEEIAEIDPVQQMSQTVVPSISHEETLSNEEPEKPAERLQPPAPVVATPVREISQEPKPEANLDWSDRGARMKRGRKLTKHASLLMKKGRYSDASIVLRDALRAFPPNTKDLTYGETLYKLGICLRQKGEPHQAIPVLQQALQFPYYRSKALREVEAATNQLRKVTRVRG